MKRSLTSLSPHWFTAAFLLAAASTNAAADDDFFRDRVEPILQQRCYECHSHAGKINGGLALDSRSGWQTGGDSGPAIVPGSPEQSRLIEAVRYGNPELEMPPKGKLPANEIALLEEWVKLGAPDPREAMKTVIKQGVDVEAGRKHWAYQPVRDFGPPLVREAAWPVNAVDSFILAKLEAEGLRPVADADSHTWLRRVTFDLTGLPPTEAEIDFFLNDKSPQAHQRVVDRLLNSKAYGERWARHWLDLVGYAEQIGTEGKVFAEHA